MYKIKTKYKTDNLMILSELLDSIKNINVSDIPTNKTNFDLLNQIANKLKNNHKQFEKLCITNKKCKRKLTGKIIYVVLCGINIVILITTWSKIIMQNKVITVTKIKNKKMSLTELVKNIEKFNVEDIPLNERNHILISKVFNKFNSLKKAHFKNAENKGIVKKIGTNEFRKVSYEYEITKTEWSK